MNPDETDTNYRNDDYTSASTSDSGSGGGFLSGLFDTLKGGLAVYNTYQTAQSQHDLSAAQLAATRLHNQNVAATSSAFTRVLPALLIGAVVIGLALIAFSFFRRGK